MFAAVRSPILVLLVLLACDSSASSCPVGSASCACTAGGACDPGLSCGVDRRCASLHDGSSELDAGGASDDAAPPEHSADAAIDGSEVIDPPGGERDRRTGLPGGGSPVGTPCNDDTDCATHNCYSYECRSDLVGSPCSGNESCRSFNCYSYECRSPDIGSPCADDDGCVSNNCYSYECQPNTEGSPCNDDTDCVSHNCYSYQCQSKTEGSPCNDDTDCVSNNCYSYVCQPG
jgi:hypothetical protein